MSLTLGGDFSVQGWVQYRQMSDGGTGKWVTVFELGRYDDGVLLRLDDPALSNGAVLWVNRVGVYFNPTGTFVTSPFAWTYFCVTRSGATCRLHVNGTLVAQLEAGGVVNAAGRPLSLGASQHAAGQHWNGVIDQLQVYKGVAVNGAAVPTGPF